MNDFKTSLTQPELGTLYVEMVVPLHFQPCLQQSNVEKKTILAMHQMFADQRPDTALISFGLCGIMLANHLLRSEHAPQEMGVLATELKYFCIDIAERYGRAWINAREDYGHCDPEEEKELLIECPDNLNAFGSIVQEIHELSDEQTVVELAKMMEYQAYAHANIAESYLEMLDPEKKRCRWIRSRHLMNIQRQSAFIKQSSL